MLMVASWAYAYMNRADPPESRVQVHEMRRQLEETKRRIADILKERENAAHAAGRIAGHPHVPDAGGDFGEGTGEEQSR